jgi:hypothetical protein
VPAHPLSYPVALLIHLLCYSFVFCIVCFVCQFCISRNSSSYCLYLVCSFVTFRLYCQFLFLFCQIKPILTTYLYLILIFFCYWLLICFLVYVYFLVSEILFISFHFWRLVLWNCFDLNFLSFLLVSISYFYLVILSSDFSMLLYSDSFHIINSTHLLLSIYCFRLFSTFIFFCNFHVLFAVPWASTAILYSCYSYVCLTGIFLILFTFLYVGFVNFFCYHAPKVTFVCSYYFSG